MISVVLPVFNEAAFIEKTVAAVIAHDTAKLVKEIIVVDGGSTDETIALVQTMAGVKLLHAAKGRASQMNAGASAAGQKILYFLHADTLPPKNYSSYILRFNEQQFAAGCFRLSFDIDNSFLKANTWFTRFRSSLIRFGDQSLFVEKDLFEKLGKFKEEMIVLEDQDLVKRIKKVAKFCVMPQHVVSSARKYVQHGVLKTQAAFFIIYAMYTLGFSQQIMVRRYKKMIKENKL